MIRQISSRIMSLETKSQKKSGVDPWRGVTCPCFTVRCNEDTSILLKSPQDVITIVLSLLRYLT